MRDVGREYGMAWCSLLLFGRGVDIEMRVCGGVNLLVMSYSTIMEWSASKHYLSFCGL